jgi:hypothetical protein
VFIADDAKFDDVLSSFARNKKEELNIHTGSQTDPNKEIIQYLFDYNVVSYGVLTSISKSRRKEDGDQMYSVKVETAPENFVTLYFDLTDKSNIGVFTNDNLPLPTISYTASISQNTDTMVGYSEEE